MEFAPVSMWVTVFGIVYFAVLITIVAIVLTALWRGMKAQESTAQSMRNLERILADRLPPGA